MRSIYWILLFCYVCSHAQTHLEGMVRDAIKKTPLAYCGVRVKGSMQSCIANEEGIFRLNVNLQKDSLIISYLGYKTRIISANSITRNKVVALESSEILIDEVVIHAGDDYLYDIMQRCRKQLNAGASYTTKLYFNFETEYQKEAVEMLECYYNCVINGNSVGDLRLKNGRIGLAETGDSSYFVSLNTSKAISYLNLTEACEYLPSLPFQYKRSKMKKIFSLQIMSVYEDGKPVYHIGFQPRKNDGTSFRGEVWMDRSSYAILKIMLSGDKIAIHPFTSLWPSSTVDSVSMNITQTYDLIDNSSILNNLHFDYRLKLRVRKADREVNTRGIMYFYDVDDPFILPYFHFDESQSDYRKITFLPYNADFWNNSKGLVHTEKQNMILAFLNEHGALLNYKHTILNDLHVSENVKLKANFFEDSYVYWSDTNRLSLKKNRLNKDSLEKLSINNLKVKADLYHFKVQIFLDINPAGDSLQWLSASVFDVFESFYKLPEEKNTNCFLNIFFDIGEIERRIMEKKLHAIAHPNLAQINAIYQQTLEALDTQTALYLKKVQSGSNFKELKKYNDYVFKDLGIDNCKIFRVTEEN